MGASAHQSVLFARVDENLPGSVENVHISEAVENQKGAENVLF